jgi:hypothetical protein
MVGFKSTLGKSVSKDELEKIIILLKEILQEINNECENAKAGKSKWTKTVLKEYIQPEMEELLTHALIGEKYYKSSTKNYRRFEATYFISDSFDGLNNTNLGILIYQLQSYFLMKK